MRSGGAQPSAPSGQQHGGEQDCKAADADRDQDELEERRDADHSGPKSRFCLQPLADDAGPLLAKRLPTTYRYSRAVISRVGMPS